MVLKNTHGFPLEVRFLAGELGNYTTVTEISPKKKRLFPQLEDYYVGHIFFYYINLGCQLPGTVLVFMSSVHK